MNIFEVLGILDALFAAGQCLALFVIAGALFTIAQRLARRNSPQ
jgi:hypothetical protein